MTSGSGGDFLAKKSDLSQLSKKLPKLSQVLIVEDENSDADRLRATLRVVLGYEFNVRRASTLGAALDCVIALQPELVFLDDLLKPADTASHTIPFLRRANYEGPIVVISGQVTRTRKAELIGLGATDVIHKDDVDSVRLTEALVRVFKVS
jgi:PleD family two-component response regulator